MRARSHAVMDSSSVVANVSAGVYRRRVFGLKPCDGSCDVCQAAARAVAGGVPVSAAAGNAPGKTACPATIGVLRPESGVQAVTLLGSKQYGYGSVAIDQASLPSLVPVPADEVEVSGLGGEEADRFMLGLAAQLSEQGDAEQSEKVYRHLMRYGGSPEARWRGVLGLGHLLNTLGRHSEAREILMSGTGPEVSDPSIRAECLFALALAAEASDPPEDPRPALEEAVRTGDERVSPLAANHLADVLIGAGDLAEAEGYLSMPRRSRSAPATECHDST